MTLYQEFLMESAFQHFQLRHTLNPKKTSNYPHATS